MTDEHCKGADQADSSGFIAFDQYGIKTRIELGDADREIQPKVPKLRPWRDIWNDVVACLQSFIVTTAKLLPTVVEQTDRTLRNVGRLSGSVSDLVQRIAKGRSRVDNEEDEKIAEKAKQNGPHDPEQSEFARQDAIRKISAIISELESEGMAPKVIEVEPGVIAFLLVGKEDEKGAIGHLDSEKSSSENPMLGASPQGGLVSQFQFLVESTSCELFAVGDPRKDGVLTQRRKPELLPNVGTAKVGPTGSDKAAPKNSGRGKAGPGKTGPRNSGRGKSEPGKNSPDASDLP
jgi:hypothetical protein